MVGPAQSDTATAKRRRATNVSLPASLLEEARALDINLSRACEDGLRRTVAEARQARWLAENAAAIEASNAWAETHGLPLAAMRRF